MITCRTIHDENFIAELRLDVAFERHYQNILNRHPDCRDPLHPGCSRCEDRDGNPTETENEECFA